MTLRRKMTWQIAAMIVGLLLVGGAGLWGLNGLHQEYGVALEGYQRLRQVYETGTHLATAQKMLQMPHPRTLLAAREEVYAAEWTFDQLPRPGPTWDVRADAAVRDGLREMIEVVESSPENAPHAELAERQRDAINAVLARIPPLAADIRKTTEARQEAAQGRRRATILTVGLLAGGVVIAGLVLGVVQYRSVMRPLARLSEGVRRVAAGEFHGRIEPRGGDEFAALADDFNRMAAELDGFYHALEQKVAAKSKELVRSERLASVGYLAAGVAHEINNPLGIISGYAEYSLSELRARRRKAAAGGGGDGCAADVEQSLQIICEEAFRCKEITGKLLSLARPGEDRREPVSLAGVAEQVVSAVGGLRQYRDRRIVLRAGAQQDLAVVANETEMKQVVLNLVLNALEAVSPPDGEVRVGVEAFGGWVELSVADTGRGMTPDVLERIFEPFYTGKHLGQGPARDREGNPQPAQPGSGLGLSISHAIVTAHGGRIEAHSDGPGKGSRFVVRLPVARDAPDARLEVRA